ncbi:hypothetical protein [Nonomuraea sp. NPDC046570]|uniref:hypothetical protein n=1 Tax=Nonomuraea sp. NPDC046570 TaxID=3155255 RepID=UPI0033DB93FE
MIGFRPRAWETAYRRRRRRALTEVPYYREHGVRPTPIAELLPELYRLCPLARPWRPEREPSLWIGDPGPLRDALVSAGLLRRGLPVLEVREALVDWRRVGPAPYATVLAPDADTGGPARRPGLLQAPAELASAAGGALLVGGAAELDRLEPELGVPVTRVTRSGGAGGLLLYDRWLGYLGTWREECAAYHLNWRRFHARRTPGGVSLTALDRRRPTLVDVLAGLPTMVVCAAHGRPAVPGQAFSVQ